MDTAIDQSPSAANGYLPDLQPTIVHSHTPKAISHDPKQLVLFFYFLFYRCFFSESPLTLGGAAMM